MTVSSRSWNDNLTERERGKQRFGKTDLSWPAGGDEEARLELHALGTLHASLTRDNNLNPERAALHDEADHAIARTSDLRAAPSAKPNVKGSMKRRAQHRMMSKDDERKPDLETTQELELERLSLGHGAEATVVHALRKHFHLRPRAKSEPCSKQQARAYTRLGAHRSLGERKPLLDSRGQLPDALALLSENLTRAGGTDDDLRPQRSAADLNAWDERKLR